MHHIDGQLHRLGFFLRETPSRHELATDQPVTHVAGPRPKPSEVPTSPPDPVATSPRATWSSNRVASVPRHLRSESAHGKRKRPPRQRRTTFGHARRPCDRG